MSSDAPAGFELLRDPADVPTPLAIAAADFCRRAGRPSSPEQVRVALARLDASEDEQVRAIVDAEPEARPLGPEALIDVVRGLPVDEAAAREDSGYYVALALIPRERAKISKPPPKPRVPISDRRAEEREEILEALRDARGKLPLAAKQLGLTEEALDVRIKRLSLVRRAKEIAADSSKGATPPRVRPKGTNVPRARPSAPIPPPLPKRGANRPPRGRIVLGPSHARDLRELEGQKGRAELRELLHSHKGNRRALLAQVNRVFRAATKLESAQLDALIERAGLRAEATRLEMENLRFLFMQARGDLGDVAKRMKLAPNALRDELEQRGLWDEAQRIRDRYLRELFGRPLGDKVQALLKRARYVRELGGLDALERHIREEAERGFAAARDLPAPARAEKMAAHLGISESNAAELISRFKLGQEKR